MQGISLGNSGTNNSLDFQEKIARIKDEIEALAYSFGMVYEIIDLKCEEFVRTKES